MLVLITGITGFVGSHLAEYYLNNTDYTVCGTRRIRSRMDNIEHILDKITLIECDITDQASVQQALGSAEPDIIHHLAAQSFVPTSFNCPTATIETNVIGTLNILEGSLRVEIDPVIQIAGSSEEYGAVKVEETPITENNPLRPLSPYGVSKVACDLLGIQYFHSYGMPIVVTRAFNHTGPRRGEVFVCSDFAKQIVQAELSQNIKSVIKHGNLDAIRDFTDVRDMVRAYALSVTKPNCIGKSMNICSGESNSYSMKDVLHYLTNMTTASIVTELDETRNRPSDVPVLIGDCSRFKQRTGWKPKIKFARTLLDIMNYWRNRLESSWVSNGV